MKWSFLLFSSFLCLQAIAQYPATGNKARLGWQTTGDGLVYRGAIGDTATLDPSGINNAWMLLDTANGNLYAYRAKAWRLVSGGGGSVSDTLTGEVKGPLDSTYIDTVANIIFTTTTDTTVGVGELEYNDTQGSLIQGLKGGNVTNVIGQQIHQRVTNATGAPLTKGTAVFLHGSQGTRITVRKALATVDSTSANTFGIVAESIADNQSGYVITEGLITNMNTNALTEGAAVYLSPTVAGELTTTKPQAPQHTVYIGVCVKQNAGSGELFVKIRNGQELDELHDVRIDSLASNASLYYNTSESVWRDTTPAALKSDISGTANYLAKFTGSNAVGNSVIQDNGTNVGISASPSSFKLDINGSTHTTGDFYADRASRSASAGFVSAQTNNRWLSGMISNSGSWHVYDLLRSTSVMTLDSATGNVGINTTTPTAKLHINNPSSTTPALNIVSNSNVIGSTNDAVSINMQPGQVNQNNTGVRVFNTITGTSAEGNNTGIAVSLNARNSSYGVYSAVSKNWGGSYLFGDAIGIYGSATTDSPAGFSYGGYFKNDTTQGTGFGVFVQTTTPKGSGTVTPLAIQHNSTELMRVQSSGNVGIATSSPSRPLHVAGTTAIRIPVGNFAQRGTSDNGDIRVRTDTASMEYYSGAWRTVAPMVRVPQSGLANRFSKFDANGLLDTSAVLVQANGRIGIWNSPAVGDSALTVTGGIMATTGVRATRLNVNTSGTQVLSINNYSGNANASPNNVFIGNGGQSATGLGTQGRNNVGIGANALLSITTGEGSIGIGTNTMALRAQIMQSNIAIGNNAMQAQGSVQNSDNTAIGTNALRYNKGGNYNVALGSNALTQNTASFNNDTAGVNSGSNNFGLGFNACYWNGAGLQNIGIGSSANYFNRNGSYNIAIGGSALAGGSTDRDTVAKNNNVVIGTQALQFLKGNGTGNSDENVAIGHYAGRLSGSGAGVSFTAGKTSVYIGAYTRAKDTVNQNEIVIGYSAIGNGSNTTTIGNSSTTNTVIPAGSLTVDVMRRKAPVTVTGNHTVADGTSWLICNGTGTIVLTLPAASSWTGREIMVKTVQPQAVNSATSNVVPIDGVATGTAILPATDGAWCTLVSDGTNWIIMQRGT